MDEQLVKRHQLPTLLTNDSLWRDLSEASQADFCGGFSSGLPTGKRQHKPLSLAKNTESNSSFVASQWGIRSIPTLML